MAWADLRSGTCRGLLAAMAIMALVMRIAVPQGFMLASPDAEAGPQLVICTGHGPLKASPAAPADKPRPDSPCAFAGHGGGAAPEPGLPIESVAFAAPTKTGSALPADVLPGRGLAAPPPPSLGPPLNV